MAGYIKLHRDILNWEWYKDIPVRILFEHCLLKANHEAKRWQGKIIEAGSFISSLDNLAAETGLSLMQIRTAINKLKSTGEITNKTTHRYSIITINNWFLYQTNNTPNNKQITNKQHTDNKLITTNKNIKKEKNNKEVEEVVVVEEKKEIEIEKQKKIDDFYGEYKNVFLTKQQYDYMFTCILDKVILERLINELSEAIARPESKYKPYDEHYPDAHFIYLKAFWKQVKEHPERFMHKTTDSGGNKTSTKSQNSALDAVVAYMNKQKGLNNEFR